MGLAGGPNITEDGLVFAYDTGNVVRSYRGEPTINYIAHQNAIPQSSYTTYSATDSGAWNTNHPNAIRAYSIDGGDITGYVNTGVGDWTNTHHAHWQYDSELGKPVTVMNCFDGNWKAKSFGAGMEAWSTYGMNAGDQYTISWLQWTNDLTKAAYTGFYSQNSSNSWNFYDGLLAPTNTRTNTWERVSATFTVSATRNLNNSAGNVYMYGHSVGSNSSPTILKIADVQLELKNHATPYTGVTAGTGGRTTRSSTQGLLDITRNNTIDLSNVSFDANAQMFFDGTDDLAPITGLTISATQNKSYEAVIKLAAGYNQIGTIFGKSRNATNVFQIDASRRVRGLEDDERLISVTILDTERWYHVVYTFEFDGTSAYQKVYVDGVLDSQRTKATYVDDYVASEQYLGYESRYSDRFNGYIDICKVYNKTLTAAEVAQNFQGIRKRFGI